MIPARFGLAIGNSGPVGHAVGHNCTPGRRCSACPRGVAARLGLVDQQGDEVVAPSSTGRRLLVEDDRGASGGAPISSSPIAWRRASAARRALTHAYARMDVPVGEGPLGRALEDQETFDPGAGLRPLSPAGAVVGARPDGALACRPSRASRVRGRRRPLPGRGAAGVGGAALSPGSSRGRSAGRDSPWWRREQSLRSASAVRSPLRWM